MQTTRMYELIDKGYKANGFLDRFLFVYPTSQKIADWADDEPSSSSSFDSYSAMWQTVIDKILTLPYSLDEDDDAVHNVLKFSKDASYYFTAWRNTTIRVVNKIKDDALVDSRIMKTPMLTARLALTIQILRWACGEVHKDYVDIDSIKAAIRLSDYFENCYTAIQKFMVLDGIEPQKKEFLNNVAKTFTTADAIQAGKEVGLSERSVMYALVGLATDKIIKKVKRGEYEKLQ